MCLERNIDARKLLRILYIWKNHEEYPHYCQDTLILVKYKNSSATRIKSWLDFFRTSGNWTLQLSLRRFLWRGTFLSLFGWYSDNCLRLCNDLSCGLLQPFNIFVTLSSCPCVLDFSVIVQSTSCNLCEKSNFSSINTWSIAPN